RLGTGFGTGFGRAHAPRPEDAKAHDVMTKPFGGKTSRLALKLCKESSNREQVRAISNKWDGMGGEGRLGACPRRSEHAKPQPASTRNAIVPCCARSMAAKSRGTRGLRSASRFVFASRTMTASGRDVRFC